MVRFGVTGAEPRSPVLSLSGGNIQRIILSRELSLESDCMLLHNPSQGLDQRGQLFVRSVLRDLTAAGHRIMLVSDDVDELSDLADEVHILLRGQLVRTLTAGFSRDKFFAAATGLHD